MNAVNVDKRGEFHEGEFVTDTDSAGSSAFGKFIDMPVGWINIREKSGVLYNNAVSNNSKMEQAIKYLQFKTSKEIFL